MLGNCYVVDCAVKVGCGLIPSPRPSPRGRGRSSIPPPLGEGQGEGIRPTQLLQRTIPALLNVRQAIALAAGAAHQESVTEYNGTKERVIAAV